MNNPLLFNFWKRINFIFLGTVLSIVLVVIALFYIGFFDFNWFNSTGQSLVVKFVEASIHPTLEFNFLRIIGKAIITTILYGIATTILCSFIGFFVGMLSSELFWESLVPIHNRKKNIYKLPWYFIRFFTTTFRSVHEIIWGLFLINIIGLDPLVAVISISVPYGLVTAKVYSEIIDSTTNEEYYALLNSGISPFVSFYYAIIPKTINSFITYIFYRFDSNLRSAVIMGMIGLEGIGFQIYLSFLSLKFNELWTMFFAVIIVGIIVEEISFLVVSNISRVEFKPRIPKINSKYFWSYIKNSKIIFVGLIILAFIVSISFVNPRIEKIFSHNTKINFSYLISTIEFNQFSWPTIITNLKLSFDTLVMSFLAISLSVLITLITAVLYILTKCNVEKYPKIRIILLILSKFEQLFLLFFRVIPIPIWAMLFLFVIHPGIFVGSIALGIFNSGVLGKLVIDAINNFDTKHITVLRDLKLNIFKIIIYGYFPALYKKVASLIFYRWEICIRATILIGLVGAGGLGRNLIEQISFFNYGEAFITLIFFLGTIIFVDSISRFVRKGIN